VQLARVGLAYHLARRWSCRCLTAAKSQLWCWLFVLCIGCRVQQGELQNQHRAGHKHIYLTRCGQQCETTVYNQITAGLRQLSQPHRSRFVTLLISSVTNRALGPWPSSACASVVALVAPPLPPRAAALPRCRSPERKLRPAARPLAGPGLAGWLRCPVTTPRTTDHGPLHGSVGFAELNIGLVMDCIADYLMQHLVNDRRVLSAVQKLTLSGFHGF
jgi:hypothetical protein